MRRLKQKKKGKRRMNDFIVFLKSLAPTETELQVGAVGGVVGPFIA